MHFKRNYSAQLQPILKDFRAIWTICLKNLQLKICNDINHRILGTNLTINNINFLSNFSFKMVNQTCLLFFLSIEAKRFCRRSLTMQTRFLDTSSRIAVWTVCLLLDQCWKVFRENQEICTLKIVMINVKHKVSKNEMITIICYTSFQWANWRKLYNQNCWELVWNSRFNKVSLNLLKNFLIYLFKNEQC